MITADEARKRSDAAREHLDADRRKKIMQKLDSIILGAIEKGSTQVEIDLDYHDTNYIKSKAIEAGYKVANSRNGILVIWGKKEGE